MSQFHIDQRDYKFLLHDVMDIENMEIEGYGDLDEGFTTAILEEGYKIARDELAPINLSGDREGCRLENGIVHPPKGFKEAFDKLREGGWTGLDCDPEYGGQGLPYLISTAVGEMHVAANMAFIMYPGLTHGAYSSIHAHASEEQKATYLPKMVSCEWTGTMNLTEPHAGTDLGMIRTKAEPQDDGSYAITGQKIFISAGDHNMSENVIHLVLAKIPGGPDGVKGISLFIVPKFMVNADGSLGERNTLGVGKLEEKMGIHGNSTCVMNFDGAKGFLVGEPHRGLKYMFTMMNEARLGVGLQGLAQAEGAYHMAVAYAKDRLQGRDVTGVKNPDGPADPLIVHPDIRRSLMTQKAYIEGGRAMLFMAANLIDKFHRAGDKDADEIASLLIPVVKSFLTDKGFECAVMAQQVFGGHGYIEETGVAQYVRDARIAMIYEGANGIQALDLVGRKLAVNGGKAMRDFFGVIKTELDLHKDDEDFYATYCDPLKDASKTLQAQVMGFVSKGMKAPNYALAGATDFLNLFGLTILALMWVRMAAAAQKAIDSGAGDQEFYKTKLVTARFYMTRILPDIHALAARIEAGETEIMALDSEQF